jgi:hypothetical protein
MPPEKENDPPALVPEELEPETPVRTSPEPIPTPTPNQSFDPIPKKSHASHAPDPTLTEAYHYQLDEIRRLQKEKEELYTQVKDLQLRFETEERFYTERFTRQETELKELTNALQTAEAEKRVALKEA